MKNIKRACITLALLATIAVYGCGDSKAPSEGNFRDAINQLMEKNNPATLRLGGEFPLKVYKTRYTSGDSGYEALVKVGLLQVQEKTETRSNMMDGSEQKQVYREFTLTEAGQKSLAKSTGLMGRRPAFKFGDPVVEKIENFTEPQSMLGSKMVQVKYTYRLQNVAPWAKDPGVQAAFPTIANALKAQEEPLEGSTVLVLTNNGWTAGL